MQVIVTHLSSNVEFKILSKRIMCFYRIITLREIKIEIYPNKTKQNVFHRTINVQ